MFSDHFTESELYQQLEAVQQPLGSLEILEVDDSGTALLKLGLAQERAFRAKTADELLDLSHTIQQDESQTDAKDTEDTAVIVARMQADLGRIEQLNHWTQTVDFKGLSSFSLKTNKLASILSGAITENGVTTSFESASEIVTRYYDSFKTGTVPSSYSFHYEPYQLTLLGMRSNTIFGNSKATCLKAALYSIRMHQTGAQRIGEIPGFNLDASACTHLTPLASGLIRACPAFKESSYFYSDSQTPEALLFFHSGYAFGGQRGESERYPRGKKDGPEDCSSWLSKITDINANFCTTLHQLGHYRAQLVMQGHLSPFGSEQGPEPLSDRLQTELAELQRICDPIKISDPQRDIRPGQLFAYRTYNLRQDPQKRGMGTSGHTGVVVGFGNRGRESGLLIFAYGRQMPDAEGFGLQIIPWVKEPENRTLMFFNPKNPDIKNAALRQMPNLAELEQLEERVMVRQML